jgi:hypothetical protein
VSLNVQSKSKLKSISNFYIGNRAFQHTTETPCALVISPMSIHVNS